MSVVLAMAGGISMVLMLGHPITLPRITWEIATYAAHKMYRSQNREIMAV